MSTSKIDLSALTMAELKQLQAEAAAIIAGQEATKLEVAAFCDEVYALAIQQGITIVDLAHALLVAETVKKARVQPRRPVTSEKPQGDGTLTGLRFKPRWVS